VLLVTPRTLLRPDNLRETLRRKSGAGVARAAARRVTAPLMRFARLSKCDLISGRRVYKVSGLLMEVPNDMAWAFVDGSYYEKNVSYWFDRALRQLPRPVVYDVGANYGYYALKAAAAGKRVCAFEPVSTTFATLEQSVSRNPGLEKVRLFRLALGAQPGTATITRYGSSGNNSIVPRSESAVSHIGIIGTEEVSVATIDELIAAGMIEPPGLIKIDTEGFELAVLRGAEQTLREHRPVLIFEFDQTIAADSGTSLGDVERLLHSCDYTLYGLSDPFAGDVDDRDLYPLDQPAPTAIGTIIAMPPGLKLPASRAPAP
jgi:FkbM family methyltransferase